MIDGRITLYFGHDDRKTLKAVFARMIGRTKLFHSEAEFMRHCIRYTLAHDAALKDRQSR